MTLTLTNAAAVAVFVATYAVMAFGRLPGLRIDRAGAALAGAAAMVALGVLSPAEVFAAIDYDTIVLLLGMMIVVANLRLAGAFEIVEGFIARNVRRPLALLVVVTVATGVLSAFLVNDTICLVMTPFVVGLALRLGRNPVPYAIAVATASNVGSVATITGNPQNMIIGSLSKIPYTTFAAALAPIAAVGLALVVVIVALVFRSEFFGAASAPAGTPQTPRPFRPALAAKTLLVTAAMVAAFFAGAPVAIAAIVAGGALLVTRRLKPARVWAEIDWPLLVMFCGLFVVTAALQKIALTPAVVDEIMRLRLGEPAPLAGVTAVLSNIVSNVPAVLVLEPIVQRLADPRRAWLIVAMASTLAGNLTLVGSVANLIVAERARALGVEVGFWPYLKVGAPLTLTTLLVGLALV